MKKMVLIIIAIILFIFCGCSDDEDDYNDTLTIIINNTESVQRGSFMVGIYNYPSINSDSYDIIQAGIEPITASQDSYTITIEDIPERKIYFAIILDTDASLGPSAGERYFLYNNRTYGENADALTLKKDEPYVLTLDFNDFKTF